MLVTLDENQIFKHQKTGSTSAESAFQNDPTQVNLSKLSKENINRFNKQYGINLMDVKNGFGFLLRLAIELSHCTELLC